MEIRVLRARIVIIWIKERAGSVEVSSWDGFPCWEVHVNFLYVGVVEVAGLLDYPLTPASANAEPCAQAEIVL